VGLREHRNVLGPKSSLEFLVQRSSDCWILKKTPVPCSSSDARARKRTHTHIYCFWCYMFWIPLSCSAATAFPNIDPPSSEIPCSWPRQPLLHSPNIMVTGRMPFMLALVPKTLSPRGSYLFESTLTKSCVYLKKFPCIRLFTLYFIKLLLFIQWKSVGDWRTIST
jgi:hypothetical protein